MISIFDIFLNKGLQSLVVILLLFQLSCSGCNSSTSPRDGDTTDIDSVDLEHDIYTETEEDSITDKDSVFIDSDVTDSDSELPDIDMHCPLPYQARYPYHREDGTIHFCRPCDTPDEYDPQCVKSLWKELNKEVYDKYKAGMFEDNAWVPECYPWPCEWDVKPTDHELAPTRVMECDLYINPYTWANSFNASKKEANMDNGKIVFLTSNYRIGGVGHFSSLAPGSGYQGQRVVLYDIKMDKYTVIGKSITPAYLSNHIIINPYYLDWHGEVSQMLIDVVPYKSSYKYSVLFSDEDMAVSLEVAPFITDKWTLMVVNHLDGKNDPVGSANRSLIYAKTGEWKWTTLAKGIQDGNGGLLSISGDNALFYNDGTNASWVCDLSKNPQKVTDCKKIDREGEVAGFPKFDRDNPNRIIYRSIKEGEAANKFVILDISKEPWKIEKEFDIPYSESSHLSIWLTQVRSNVLLYREKYLLDSSGYEADGKLCFYRLDTEKTYCSKLIEGRKDYTQGFASFEGKYLFWQPSLDFGYILRDMECYCEKTGVCPYEGMSGLPSIGVGN